jgi:hypothetical protein
MLCIGRVLTGWKPVLLGGALDMAPVGGLKVNRDNLDSR